MPATHHDETTIDLHGAKPIDMVASDPDEVRQELLEGDMANAQDTFYTNVVMLLLVAMGVVLLFGATFVGSMVAVEPFRSWHEWPFFEPARWIAIGAIAVTVSYMKWRQMQKARR